MSDLEKEELCSRVKSMTKDEKIITAMILPADIMWEELRRRYVA